MPKHCVVYKCHATNTNSDRSFHKIPHEPRLKQAWLGRIRRDGFKPNGSSSVCSYHFSPDDFAAPRNDTPPQFRKRKLKQHAVPSHNLTGEEEDTREPKRRTGTSRRARSVFQPAETVQQLEIDEQAIVQGISERTETDGEEDKDEVSEQSNEPSLMSFGTMAERIRELESQLFRFKNLSEDSVRKFTGISRDSFVVIAKMIKLFQPLHYWTGKAVVSLTVEDQLLLTLSRLKLNSPYYDLSQRFNISTTTALNVFRTYLQALHGIFFTGCMDKIPSLEKNRRSLPSSFIEHSHCRVVIDCTEFQIETPRQDLSAAVSSYSNYKGFLSAKYLIAVAPNGGITFVSNGYAGSTSDKMVTSRCGIISQLNVSIWALLFVYQYIPTRRTISYSLILHNGCCLDIQTTVILGLCIHIYTYGIVY